jgi:hypothetical protein
MAKNHPIRELTMSEFVCKNAQNTRANHIKELVTPATSEFHKSV